MNAQAIQFSHGNSYPASCYQQLLIPLQTQYSIHAVEMFGHHPDYPVTDGWTFLVRQLIDHIKAFSQAPVIGIGHSLGGVLTILAAHQEPALFEKIIILDSPVYGAVKSMLIKWIKKINLIDRFTPGRYTLGRKRHWDNEQKAIEYLKSKSVFEHFTDECLKDYINYGMEVTPKGLQLKYDVQTEYKIYRTLPHDLKTLKRQLATPVTLIYGKDSNIIQKADVRAMNKALQNFQAIAMEGTHLFPFEYPKKTAKLILKVLEEK